MKALPKRKRNHAAAVPLALMCAASMKALPKRKGSSRIGRFQCRQQRLNESLHLKVQSKRSRSHLEGILICLVESPYENVEKWIAEAEELKGASGPQ